MTTQVSNYETAFCAKCGDKLNRYYAGVNCQECRKKKCATCGAKFTPPAMKERRNCSKCHCLKNAEYASKGLDPRMEVL